MNEPFTPIPTYLTTVLGYVQTGGMSLEAANDLARLPHKLRLAIAEEAVAATVRLGIIDDGPSGRADWINGRLKAPEIDGAAFALYASGGPAPRILPRHPHEGRYAIES